MKKVLFICTSADRINDEWETGVWLEELASPYYTLTDSSVTVDICSPKGGKVPFDKLALTDEYITDAVTRFMGDVEASNKIENSTKLSDINFGEYDAVFFPGGHGAVVDLPNDELLAEKLRKFFDSGKPVGSICHGPGGLVKAKRADGKSIVYGKKLTCFSNDEEKELGVEEKVPFLLQSKLSELGGKFEKNDNFTENVVIDGNLITGQNPASSEQIGKALLEAIITKQQDAA